MTSPFPKPNLYLSTPTHPASNTIFSDQYHGLASNTIFGVEVNQPWNISRDSKLAIQVYLQSYPFTEVGLLEIFPLWGHLQEFWTSSRVPVSETEAETLKKLQWLPRACAKRMNRRPLWPCRPRHRKYKSAPHRLHKGLVGRKPAT